MPHTATYNQDNDKLYLFPGERLTDDEYQRVSACGLRWWRGHRLSAKPPEARAQVSTPRRAYVATHVLRAVYTVS